jgi:pimeloyl-ACP methyl ester carboxylesterase
MTESREEPLILLPGMGADERVFRLQAVDFPRLLVPRWIPPGAGESLSQYAKRMAAHVDPGRQCVVGGMSFGGTVALEMAAHLNARACILLASVRSQRELPWRLLRMRPLTRMLPFVPAPWSGKAARLALNAGGERLGPSTRAFLEQLASADGPFLRWASWALLTWQPAYDANAFPIHQIHGDRDRVLPHRLTRPDVLVPGAGHLLTITHPEQVNTFIRSCLARTKLDAPEQPVQAGL